MSPIALQTVAHRTADPARNGQGSSLRAVRFVSLPALGSLLFGSLLPSLLLP
jgi:hypothetical protein